MKLLFVNPPRIGRRRLAVESEDCCWGIGPLVLPSMLLAAASEAKRMGHEVEFIDWAIDLPGGFTFKPDIIVHPLAWQWWEKVNQRMHYWCKDIGARRVIFAVPPGYADTYLEKTDSCVIPEHPERTISSCAIFNGDLFWPIAQSNCGLDKLAPIDYNLVPSHYWPHYQAAVYQVTRGCPYRCTFCVWGGSTCTDPSFKMRPAELVANNLADLYNISSKHRNGEPIPLYLLAAQLTTDLEWIETFHRTMIQFAHPFYPFQSNVNFSDMTEEKLDLLRASGLISAGASLDGAAPSILRLMHKPFTMEKAIEGMLLMKKHHLLRRCRVRYGVGETQEDVASAIQWATVIHDAGIQHLQMNIAPIIHYKGTMIHDAAAYPLAPLPGKGPARLVMADPPDWTPYADHCRSLGWSVRVGPKK